MGIERFVAADGRSDGPFQWKVVTYPARLCSRCEDDTNVIRIPEGKKLATIVRLLGILLKQKTDMVHCVGLSRISVCCAWAALLLRRPYVFELSIDPSPDIMATLGSRLVNLPLCKASGYIALTPRLDAYFRSLSSGRPVFLRANPVALEAPAEEGENLPSGTRSLLLGRFSPRKGQEVALETLAHLPREQTLILAGPVIGKQDEAYVDRLKAMTKQLGLEDRVEFRSEFVSDVAALIRQCRSVWCFSRREGLPNVVLEALWSGRPVFVNATLGLGHIVKDGINGLNLPEDVTEKARLIQGAIRKGFDSRMISRQAQQMFDLGRHAEATYRFLASMASP